jgi:hypothetical protein
LSLAPGLGVALVLDVLDRELAAARAKLLNASGPGVST